MKAEVYDTVNFPAYAVCAFEYGNPLENKTNNLDMIDWEMQLHVDIIQDGHVFVGIEFGEAEYFSKAPCFGPPCNCVDAVVYVKKM